MKGLAWTIGKRRRLDGGFLGYDRIIAQLGTVGVDEKRIGFIIHGAPAREGCEILMDGKVVGNFIILIYDS